MVNQAEEPLEKVTLNLFKRDTMWFRRHYGQGYTKAIRLAIRKAVLSYKKEEQDGQE